MATLQTMMLCYPERLEVELNVSEAELQIWANSNDTDVSYSTQPLLQEALSRLNLTMQEPVGTYIGGIPG